MLQVTHRARERPMSADGTLGSLPQGSRDQRRGGRSQGLPVPELGSTMVTGIDEHLADGCHAPAVGPSAHAQ